MNQPKRYIKFTSKKCVMRPFDNELGTIETWEINESNSAQKEHFIYEEQKYELTSSTKKKIKSKK